MSIQDDIFDVQMEEKKYIVVSNRVNISNALSCLRGITPGEESGIGFEKWHRVMHILLKAERECFKIIDKFY